MDKSEVYFNSLFIDKCNKQRKENCLKDFQDSFRNYSKTGIKNEVLTMFSEHESEFKKKYSLLWEESQQNSMMEQMEYMCYIKMMYDLFHKEEKIKKTEEQYLEFHNQYPDLVRITQKISEKRKMYLKELEAEMKWTISIKDMINKYEEFFYFKERKEGILVSLTTSGIKYNNFISSRLVAIPYDVMSQVVYNNSNNILESFQKSLDSGSIDPLELEGMESEKKRAIKHKYRLLISDILRQREEYYDIDIVYSERKIENYYDNKERFKIPVGLCDEME